VNVPLVNLDINSIQLERVCHVDHMIVVMKETLEMWLRTVIHAVQI